MRSFVLVLALMGAACASTSDEPPMGPPSLDVSPNTPAPERARFFADCIAQSTQAQSYFREQANDELIRFNCDGDVARRFFGGLGPYATEVGAELVVANRTWRFTTPIRENTVGLDYCWRDEIAGGEPVHECTVVLNVGPYLRD
jgi:hypothetical protein